MRTILDFVQYCRINGIGEMMPASLIRDAQLESLIGPKHKGIAAQQCAMKLVRLPGNLAISPLSVPWGRKEALPRVPRSADN